MTFKVLLMRSARLSFIQRTGENAMPKSFFIVFIGSALGAFLISNTVNAQGYQHGWKVYEKPQAGYTYGGIETNPYGPGGSLSYGPGGGQSYGPGGGQSYGPGGGQSYGPGGGLNPANPWSVSDN
ncbi:hypothetical protein [Magnetofaba australis]|uniref:hypothetical protein n=1 Tax=Magnetofaba australis TaxID=1472297 RepID=UPI0011806265|nr:hypothetical protein [Magnetofaba australis]